MDQTPLSSHVGDGWSMVICRILSNNSHPIVQGQSVQKCQSLLQLLYSVLRIVCPAQWKFGLNIRHNTLCSHFRRRCMRFQTDLILYKTKRQKYHGQLSPGWLHLDRFNKIIILFRMIFCLLFHFIPYPGSNY